MSKVHALEVEGQGIARCILHTPVPTGNNTVGKSWKNCLLNSGRSGSTILPEGDGAGQITLAQKTQVLSGDVIELPVNININSIQLTPQAISDYADALIVEEVAKLKASLKYFGYSL